MILAAGVGSRMDPLTQGTPKPLAPILGKPVMEHIITLCKNHGFDDLSANIHVKSDIMQDHFKDSKNRFGVNLNLVHEKELTGVGGGIRSCRNFLTDDSILIIMGDAITDADLSHLYEEHKKSGCLVTCGIMEVEDTTQYGVIVTDKKNRIISFQEKPSSEDAKSNLANTGIYFFNQSILKNMPSEDEIPFYDVAKNLFPKLMNENAPLQAVKIKGYWADIGTLKQYQISLADALDGKIKVNIEAKKTNFGYVENCAIIDSSIKTNGKAYIGKNVRIGSNVTLTGHVVIESNCIIDDNAYIGDSVIWSNSRICKNAKVISSIIGNNCTVNENVEILANSVWAPSTEINNNSKPFKVLN